jgi:hypothetical protein
MDGSWMPSTNTLTYNNTPRTGAWNVRLRKEGQTFLTRKIVLTAGKAYSLEFFARQDGANPANAKVQAKFGTGATNMTETIVAQAGLTNGDYQRFYGVFTPPSTGDYYIGIQGWINSVAWYISMDDITIAELPPAPPIASFPFFEGFETGNIDQSTMIKDWAQVDGPSYSGQFWTSSNNGTNYNTAPKTGNWNAILRYSGQSSLFRRIELIAGKIYSIELYARQDGATATDAMIQVNYGTEPTLAGMNRTIIASTGLTNGDYQKISGTFTAAATGVYYIGIRGSINNTPWRISLDDITIDIVPPITSLPFRENFDTGNFDQIVPQNWGQITGPEHTGKEWSMNYVETGSNREPRSGLYNVTLMWNGQSCMYRPIQMTGGKTYFIEFYARQDGMDPANATVQVKIGTGPTLASMNQNIIPETGLTNGDYQRFYKAFTPTTTGIYYIGIQGWINSTPWFISLDDIIIDELAPAITSLPFVEGFETGNTHNSTVVKNWNQTFGPEYSRRNWTANNTNTSLNRAPRTGGWNTTLVYNGDTSLTRRIQLTAGKIYSFELYARQDTDNPANAKIQVLYGVDGSLIDQTIIAQTGLTNGNYQRFFGTFTASSTNTYYIAIHGWSNHLVQYISLDDITIGIVMPEPIALPFTEDWDSEGFAANHWTKEGDNWWVDAEIGSPEPSVNFYYHPREFNYEIALNSHDFDATGMDQVQFSFDLCLSNDDASVENAMTWMIWDGDSWTWLGEYSSLNGELDWSTYTYNISEYASNRIFKIRFVASGVDSYAINNWYIDNITLAEVTAGDLGRVTDLVISQVGSNIILNWSPVDGATWYHVEKSQNPAGPFVSVGYVGTNMSPVAMSGLPGNKYFFRVRAGYGARSGGEIMSSAPATSSPSPARAGKLELAPKPKRN